MESTTALFTYQLPSTIFAGVIGLAGLFQNMRANNKATIALAQGDQAAEATELTIARDKFVKKIYEEFKRLVLHTNTIVEYDSYLTKMEKRITTILSDYTALLNQVSIVATLMLGVATATFGSLLGNTDDQAQWKVNMYVISCVITICLSVYSVIESFFLSIHIYAEESKFIAGLYPHQDTGARSFNLDTLKGLSSSYSAVIVVFFLSFLSFSLTVLSTIYIGLGLSQSVLITDDRLASYQLLSDNSTLKLSEMEPGFVGVAVTTTIIVIITYMTILWLFVTKYKNYIMWPNTFQRCFQMPRESLKQPMRFTAEEFERLQNKLHAEFDIWNKLKDEFIHEYEQSQTLDDFETDIFDLIKAELELQAGKLKQLRLLQITDTRRRNELGLSRNSDESKSELLYRSNFAEIRF